MVSIKFRAGKVNYDVQSHTATPEPTQGVVTIKPSDDDEETGFYTFEWAPKDNVVNLEKDELLIVAGDATWTHIKECKTGRVFALEFLSSGVRHFFWMQETNENEDDPSELSKKDIEVTQKIQKLLEEEEESQDVEVTDAPPASETKETSDASAAPTALLPVYDLNDFVENIDFKQLVDDADEATLEKLYEYVPESLEKNKENLLNVLHSGYMKRGASNLSEALNNGGGFVVSRSLDNDYEGEGISAYLNATRKKSKKEDEK
ncbi:CYFA0S11e00760g1_1 [Cyberlindnera fabianii]|uniref:CYFA0S11e00760g1_1 n=1 Tax=Cyberlindnera fabianii TaxID=36022 RepID=A0A061B8C0_CYBFA|nr:CYFA0S11e00760g1_1 [Cyberlindnera fabianii]